LTKENYSTVLEILMSSGLNLQLIELDLSNNPDLPSGYIVRLQEQFSNLKTLKLNSCNILCCQIGFLPDSHLRELQLSENPGLAGMLLTVLHTCNEGSRLERLDLDALASGGASGDASLAAELLMQSLTKLTIRRFELLKNVSMQRTTNLTIKGWATLFAYLFKCSGVSSLNFNYCEWGNEVFNCFLAEFTKSRLPYLASLSIDGCQSISEVHWKKFALSVLQEEKVLIENLSLSDCHIDDAKLEALMS